jgi:hypothetical protein
MNVSWTGELREFFHTFLPGLFLMVNIVGSCYACPVTSTCVERTLGKVPAQDGLIVAAILSFGYLAGVVLRLIRPDHLVKWSRNVDKRWYAYKHKSRRDDKSQKQVGNRAGDSGTSNPEQVADTDSDPYLSRWNADERVFPYSTWIGWLTEKRYLPDKARVFYEDSWMNAASLTQNREYFNFCKSAVYQVSPESAKEVQGAEAFIRYMSGIFWSLSISILILLLAATAAHPTLWCIALPLIVLYILAAALILTRFETIRVKEVLILFAACCANRDKIGDLLTVNSDKALGIDR